MNELNGKKILFFLLVGTLISITGCSHNRDFSFATSDGRVASLPKDLDIVAVSHLATDAMIQQAGAALKPALPILVTSFVNIDNLNDTSSFGRITSEHFGSRLTQQGYTVSELRLRQGDVLVQKKRGEFALTRDLKKLLRNYEAQAIVVGTYAIANNVVYVTSKLISPASNSVIASSDYSLPLGPNTRRLLGLDLPRAIRPATNQQSSNFGYDDPDWIML